MRASRAQDADTWREMDAADVACETSASCASGLPGRLSGCASWVAARGEGGGGASVPGAQTAAEPGLPQGTRFRLAEDGQAPNACSSTRVRGGAVRASGENLPGEGAVRAFDGLCATKWLDFTGGSPGARTWIEYRLRPQQPAQLLDSYALTSANDAPERDPKSFTLQGLPDTAETSQGLCCDDVGNFPLRVRRFARSGVIGKWLADNSRHAPTKRLPTPSVSGWVDLDTQSGVEFAGRHQHLSFQLRGEPRACRAWRLVIRELRDGKSANAVQLACLDLFARPLKD